MINETLLRIITKKYLQVNGIKNKHICDKCKIYDSDLTKWLSGNRSLKQSTLEEIQNYLEKSYISVFEIRKFIKEKNKQEDLYDCKE